MLGGEAEQRGLPLLEGQKVPGLVVRDAIDPAAVKAPDPLERQCAKRSLMAHAAGTGAFIEGASPGR